MKVLNCSLLIALLSLSSSSYAEAYRCKTPQGATVFQDKPCSNGAKGGEMQIRSLPNGGAAGVSTNQDWRVREQQSQEQKKQQQEAETKEAENRARQNRQLCSEARRNLDVLKSPGAVYNLDPKGQRNYLDDKNRDNEINQAEKRVKEYCDAL